MSVNCFPLDQLIEMWNEDAIIDETEPGKAIIRIPVLHSKYLNQLTAHSVALKMKTFKFIELKKLKIDYYSGRLDKAKLDELGWEQFGFILKTDLNAYLEADQDLIKLKEKMINNEESIAFCTAVIKELNSRTYQLRSFMDWQRFTNGSG